MYKRRAKMIILKFEYYIRRFPLPTNESPQPQQDYSQKNNSLRSREFPSE